MEDFVISLGMSWVCLKQLFLLSFWIFSFSLSRFEGAATYFLRRWFLGFLSDEWAGPSGVSTHEWSNSCSTTFSSLDDDSSSASSGLTF